MKKLYKVDEDGLFLEEVLFEDNELVETSRYVETPLPQGIYLPARFKDGKWETTLTEDQIKEKHATPETSIQDQLKTLQQAVDDLILGGML